MFVYSFYLCDNLMTKSDIDTSEAPTSLLLSVLLYNVRNTRSVSFFEDVSSV